MHTLLLNYLPIGAVEVEIVIGTLVLLCKMRRMFVFTVKSHAYSERKIVVPFFPLLPVLFVDGHSYFACLASSACQALQVSAKLHLFDKNSFVT